MTTLNVSADFARATRRSQVAYRLTSFAYLRCGVVVGTSSGNVMVIRGSVVGNIFIIIRRFVGQMVLLLPALEGPLSLPSQEFPGKTSTGWLREIYLRAGKRHFRTSSVTAFWRWTGSVGAECCPVAGIPSSNKFLSSTL